MLEKSLQEIGENSKNYCDPHEKKKQSQNTTGWIFSRNEILEKRDVHFLFEISVLVLRRAFKGIIEGMRL